MTLVTAIGSAVVALVLLLALAWQARSRGVRERASRPRALAHAELVYMETLFRIREPLRLVAKVDRVYRLPGGRLVLVELKTRRQDRPYLTDIIQLSAQKLALEVQTGEVVEPYAFVTVLPPNQRRHWQSHRVTLLDAGQLLALARRREAILARRIGPTYAASEGACVDCAFRSRCDRSDPRG